MPIVGIIKLLLIFHSLGKSCQGQWRWIGSQVIIMLLHSPLSLLMVCQEPGNESSIGLAASLSRPSARAPSTGNLTYAANTGEEDGEDMEEKRLAEHKRVIAFPFFVLAGLSDCLPGSPPHGRGFIGCRSGAPERYKWSNLDGFDLCTRF